MGHHHHSSSPPPPPTTTVSKDINVSPTMTAGSSFTGGNIVSGDGNSFSLMNLGSNDNVYGVGVNLHGVSCTNKAGYGQYTYTWKTYGCNGLLV